MRLKGIKCPECGANLELNTKGQRLLFCPYCGGQIDTDDGEIVITQTINKNININKKITDDAKIARQIVIDKQNEREDKQQKRAIMIPVLIVVILFAIAFLMDVKENRDAKKKEDAGMIKVGQSYSAFVDKNYLAVKAQLESAGFVDITTVDLDDAGWFKNKEDTVESVTIGGDATFYSSDYFDPNDKVVISYH